MKKWMRIAVVSAAIAWAGPAAFGADDKIDTGALVREFTGVDKAQPRTPDELEGAYESAIRSLVKKLTGDNADEARDAGKSLELMAIHATRPFAESQRLAICRSMVKVAHADIPIRAKVVLLRHVERAGGEEVVDVLAALLAEPDPAVQQHALLALTANPSAKAGEVIISTLGRTSTPQGRVMLLNAIGMRRDASAAGEIARLLADTEPGVSTAAASALGKIGNAEAAASLGQLAFDPQASDSIKKSALDAYLLCADALSQKGNSAVAAAIYSKVHSAQVNRRFRIAALRGLVLHQDEAKGTSTLMQALKSEEPQIYSAAARLIVEIPGKSIVRELSKELAMLPTASRALAIVALGERGDAEAKEAVLASARSPELPVSIAAIEAIGKLGDATMVEPLAQWASAGDDTRRNRARESLNQLRGAEVEPSMLLALSKAEPKVRIELVRSLNQRAARGTADALLARLANEEDLDVRVELLNALGALGGESALEPVVKILASPRHEREMTAAENAAGAIALRVADPERRSAPIIAALAKSSGDLRLPLIRLLGKTGSPNALVPLRKALDEENAEVHMAAVRALSDWPDATVAGDLFALSKSDGQEKARVLALRGYIRVVMLPSDRTNAETARLLADAIAFARADEQKLAVSAIGNLPCLESLKILDFYLDRAGTSAEARLAVMKIAEVIRETEPSEVMAMVRRVRDGTPDRALKRNAEILLAKVERGGDDFITDWRAAGPYTRNKVEGKDLFDVEFGPEIANSIELKWIKMPVNKEPGKAWYVDLLATEMKGDHRVAYLRTAVWSPKDQQTRLECGSDDSMKVWLNGKLVHEKEGGRANVPANDKVKVNLKEGWNSILVKVVNETGTWGINARFRTTDGRPLEGIKVSAD